MRIVTNGCARPLRTSPRCRRPPRDQVASSHPRSPHTPSPPPRNPSRRRHFSAIHRCPPYPPMRSVTAPPSTSATARRRRGRGRRVERRREERTGGGRDCLWFGHEEREAAAAEEEEQEEEQEQEGTRCHQTSRTHSGNPSLLSSLSLTPSFSIRLHIFSSFFGFSFLLILFKSFIFTFIFSFLAAGVRHLIQGGCHRHRVRK
jgi:hypothetical protein